MKTIQLLTLLIGTLLINSCEFHKSVNKDLTTGAFSKGDGIGCDEIKIQVNGKNAKSTKFIDGQKINFVFENISGLKKVKGKVFPGLSMIIIKNGRDTVIYEKDLFNDITEGTDLSPLQLQAHFLANFKFETSDKFKLFIKIWDKRDKGTFEYELPFSVQPNKLLRIHTEGINYTNIYLWDETNKQTVAEKEIDFQNTFILILEGLDGLEEVNGRVYPAFSIEIIDNEGNIILSNAAILEQYKKDGVEAKGFDTRQLPVTITFTPGRIANPCTLTASLTDLKSKKRLNITSELKIE